MSNRTVAKAVKLRAVEIYGIHGNDDAGGVYMDATGGVYLTRDDSKPKPCTLSEALEFMALRHSDGPEGYRDATPKGTPEFFKMLASKLRGAA